MQRGETLGLSRAEGVPGVLFDKFYPQAPWISAAHRAFDADCRAPPDGGQVRSADASTMLGRRAEEQDVQVSAERGGVLARGVEVIRAALKTLPPRTRRLSHARRQGRRALCRQGAQPARAASPTTPTPPSSPTGCAAWWPRRASLEVVVTHTEVEALLLESNLIKRLMPRYNVLLRDDKSFPYIHLTGGHDFPQIIKHRGARDARRRVFRALRLGRRGQPHARSPCSAPFCCAPAATASSRAARAPACSTRSSAAARLASAASTRRATTDLVAEATRLPRRPQQGGAGAAGAAHAGTAPTALDFESAALVRDRIRALTHVQGRQDINVEGVADADVIAAHQAGGQTCVQVFFFRGGQNWGNRAYFPSHDRQLPVEEVLAAFIGQFYDNKPPPPLHPAEPRAAGLRAPRRGARRPMPARKVELARAAARRQARSSSSTPSSTRARRWAAASPRAPRSEAARRAWRRRSASRRRRSASRSTTTATSRGATRSAP